MCAMLSIFVDKLINCSGLLFISVVVKRQIQGKSIWCIIVLSSDFCSNSRCAMENAYSDAKVKTLHHLVDGAVEALEFRVTSDTPFLDIPLKDLKLKGGILLAGIVRQNGQIIIPMGGDSLQIGDDVIVVTAGKGIQDLRDILL